MKRVQYVKGMGSAVVKVSEVDFDRKPESRIERFEEFFQGVPLYGGEEWKTLSVDDIVSIFRGAAVDILEVYQQRHDDAIREHSKRNHFARWWQEFRGWKAPQVPSQEEIIQDMATRCRDLSDWMEQNSARSFFEGSDMSVFIYKPTAVAKQLVS